MPIPSWLVHSSLLLTALAGACTDAAPEPHEAPESRDAPLQSDVDTLLASVSALDSIVQLDRATSRVGERFDRITATVDALAIAATDLRDSASALAADQLSIRAAQLAPQLRALKRAVQAASLDEVARRELLTALARVKLAAQSLNRSAVESSSLVVLDEGHIDAVDAAFEDGALGISIHDETVEPDVEREPSDVVLVVKASAKQQVPDDRFGFLGPAGTTVWILPENELDAAAAAVLFAGIATEEIEPGAFLGDTVQVRFKQVFGPNGFSLFESPPDDTTPPVVLVDSENGLPDDVTLPVGTHRHANWAFEAPGVYFVKVAVRGRLASVAGNPWITSPTETLRFVVRP